VAELQKPLCDMKPDESRRTGDEDVGLALIR
jgi:hypothetical protein